MIEADPTPRGVVCYDRLPPQTGGFVLAETFWVSCLPLVDKLVGIGIAAYCPIVLERRRNERRGVVTVRTPAFGGYFWLANRPDIEIPETIVLRFRLFYQEGFYWFSEDEIEHMRELEAGWPVLRPNSVHRERFAKAEKIEVVAGPFQGRHGIVQADSGLRVKVSLGGFVIDLPPFMIAKAEGA